MATAAVYNRLHNSSLGGGGSSGGLGHHSQLARSLERILEDAHLSGELILTNRKLKDFPKTGTKFHLGDTVIADLSRNRFCELPEEITSFAFLETLLLYHNAIRSIPESVKSLTSLTYLDLRSNQLSTLPREVCFLPLHVLLVSNNRLAALPDELGRMDRLTDLDASYNQLTALPARIGELCALRSLSLRSNQLLYLPRELTCLTLVSLDVSNNRITSLPLEIRQMATLVEFNIEHNPLTSPPASLCIRGLVHVFKFLETQASKDEKGSRAGGNYDGYTTLRRAPRHNANGNVLESNRVPRHQVDSGYSTCDGIDKRWSHDMPNVKAKIESPARRTPTTPPSSLSAELMDASLTSSTSTIVDESISVAATAAVVKPLPVDSAMSPSKRVAEPSPATQQSQATLHQHISYAPSSSSSNGSSPEQEDVMLDQHQQQEVLNNQNGGKADEKMNKNLGNIQTYREYKEALKQQRNQEISSVYKIKGQKTLYDMSEATQALNSNSVADCIDKSSNGVNTLPKSIMKNGTNGMNGNATINGMSADDCVVIPKKPIQKVIPSRNTELMSSQAAKLQTSDAALTNGVDCMGYVKPNSPMKTVTATANGTGGSGNMVNGGGILTNSNNKFANTALSSAGMKSPVGGASKLGTAKTQRTVTWNHDIPAEKLSFTMRREFDRQREEIELMSQLRSIIETRLKMTLPEDIASALTDGVILCHLANYVRPRSVASIHVPSPGVSKLTMARCRRNVDNFLEACRKIGVDEELICSCADVVPPPVDDECNNSNTNNNFVQQQQQQVQQQQHHQQQLQDEQRQTLPNPAAVLKTVSALIALDFNPHHQSVHNMQQQQYKMLLKQQQQQQHYQQQQQLQQQLNYQRRCMQELAEEDIEIGVDDTEAVTKQQHEQEQQQQLTATCTKQQMQPRDLVANHMTLFEQQNCNFQYNTKCHFETTHNGNASETHAINMQHTHKHTQYQVNNYNYNSYSVNNDDNSSYNDADNGVDNNIVDSSATQTAAYILPTTTTTTHNEQQEQQSAKNANSISSFLRHAKLKTFQKIKLNLIATHSSSSSSNNNNHNAATTTTLQTIVETENDVLINAESSNGSGMYHQLINEKSKSECNQSATETCSSSGNSKYKLLELPKLERNECAKKEQSKNASPLAIVSKRIEFFEHTRTTPTAALSPIGINAAAAVAIVKPKMKHNIFSIYRGNDAADAPNTNAAEKLLKEQEAGTSTLLRHDSHVLTGILSCIFIVTFLLLVFFPLPG